MMVEERRSKSSEPVIKEIEDALSKMSKVVDELRKNVYKLRSLEVDKVTEEQT